MDATRSRPGTRAQTRDRRLRRAGRPLSPCRARQRRRATQPDRRGTRARPQCDQAPKITRVGASVARPPNARAGSASTARSLADAIVQHTRRHDDRVRGEALARRWRSARSKRRQLSCAGRGGGRTRAIVSGRQRNAPRRAAPLIACLARCQGVTIAFLRMYATLSSCASMNSATSARLIRGKPLTLSVSPDR